MTCKDCIHSGLCYKENDYDNFPDRCGEFISNKVLEEKPQGEWIPVSERLPEEKGHYIVSTDYGDVTMDSFVDGIFVLNLGSVIAWQPLPEPYKEAENG